MPLFLVGMPGCGKSTLAKLLASELQWPIRSSDEDIVRQESRSISSIFSTSGEQYFRNLEADWFYNLPPWGEFIADTGGGLPCHHHLMLGIRSRGPSVYLNTSSKTILDRLNQRGILPATLAQPNLDAIEIMLANRQPFYRLADFHLNADEETPETLCYSIIRYFELK